MKKALAILIGMVLVLSLVCSVNADTTYGGTIETHGGTATTLVSFDISEDYNVEIPAKISLDSTNGRGKGQVIATVNRLDPGQRLYVNLSSDVTGQYDDGSKTWKMTNAEHTADLRYYVWPSVSTGEHADKDHNVGPGATILQIDHDADDKSVEMLIHCHIKDYNIDLITVSGEYSGTLTFVVDIVNNV